MRVGAVRTLQGRKHMIPNTPLTSTGADECGVPPPIVLHRYHIKPIPFAFVKCLLAQTGAHVYVGTENIRKLSCSRITHGRSSCRFNASTLLLNTLKSCNRCPYRRRQRRNASPRIISDYIQAEHIRSTMHMIHAYIKYQYKYHINILKTFHRISVFWYSDTWYLIRTIRNTISAFTAKQTEQRKWCISSTKREFNHKFELIDPKSGRSSGGSEA